MRTLALIALLAAAPTGLDTRGYDSLFVEGGSPGLLRWEVTVVLDDEDDWLVRTEFETSEGPALPERIPLAVVDAALGDQCELLGESAGVEGATVVQDARYPAAGHLGDPRLCELLLSAPQRSAGQVAGTLEVRRPRRTPMDHRFATWIPVQPLAWSAESVRVGAEFAQGETPRVLPVGWGVDLLRRDLDGDRRWVGVELSDVAALPPPTGVYTLVGRAPGLAVTTGASWDAIATEHRDAFESAAGGGGIGRLAGRVVAQPNVDAAVREAVRLAMDEITLDGGGGTFHVPRSAAETMEVGSGTAADRAALLVALLRAADLRAEVVLASDTPLPIHPDHAVPLLNRTLVLLPKVAIGGAGPTYVDAARGSAWLGVLDESLLGRDALLLGPRGARWLRLPDTPPTRAWNLNASELKDGRIQVGITGSLSGAAAARVREWDATGRTGVTDELSWAGPWLTALTVELTDDGATLAVDARGELDRDVALPNGQIPAMPRPSPAVGVPGAATAWASDARPLTLSARESWTFRGIDPGAKAPGGESTTPFWTADVVASWAGPVFQRKADLAFVGRVVPTGASAEVDRWDEYLSRLLGPLRAPAAP